MANNQMNRFRPQLINQIRQETQIPRNKNLFNVDIRFISTFMFAGLLSGLNWYYQSKWA